MAESTITKPLLCLWLSELPGIRAQTGNRLLEHFGSLEAIYAADRQQLLAVSRLKTDQLDALTDKSLDTAKRLLDECTKKQVQIITQEDNRYPNRLRTIENPPLALYVRGTWQDLDRIPAITVIGTRHASAYGLSISEQLGYLLGKAGFVVLSGMALGNDGAAHRGVLRAGGCTMAVLADSPDICFPAQHATLMQDILVAGAVISEIPPGGSRHKPNYHMRNRILSGLSVAVVVVEASAGRSGTIITAHHAANQGRDVYAVPGAINAPASAGCNEMIACGDAMILTRLDSLVTLYRSQLPKQPKPSAQATRRQTTAASPSAMSSTSVSAPLSAPMSASTSAPTRKGSVCSPEQRTQSRRTKPAVSQESPAKSKAKPTTAPSTSTSLPSNLTADEQQIIELVQRGFVTPNDLIEQGTLPPSKVMSLLTILEMKGILTLQAGRFVYMP